MTEKEEPKKLGMTRDKYQKWQCGVCGAVGTDYDAILRGDCHKKEGLRQRIEKLFWKGISESICDKVLTELDKTISKFKDMKKNGRVVIPIDDVLKALDSEPLKRLKPKYHHQMIILIENHLYSQQGRRRNRWR